MGLLRALAEPFCQVNHCRVNWIKKGSGASLKALKAGEVDMVMVHAPAAEKKAVREGWATMRTLLGSNEFYIVGPGHDPAGIKTAKTAKGKPTIIIARTVKGKGVSFMENVAMWHGKAPSKEQMQLALEEISQRVGR